MIFILIPDMKIEMQKCLANYYLTPEHFDYYLHLALLLIMQYEIYTFIFIVTVLH